MTSPGEIPEAELRPARSRLPRTVWSLGLVALCMDLSSETVHAILPIFLVSGLGASTLSVGFVEGVAEATASFSRLFSGVLSDWLQRRKILVLVGYGLSAASKPLFPLANSVGAVVAARVIDRLGKGIRGAPRDAMIADATPPILRGAAYGLRQAFDSVGAFLGPLLAFVLMESTGNQFRTVFWAAVIPAFIGVLLLVLFVDETLPAVARTKDTTAEKGRSWLPIHRADIARLGREYWLVVVAAGMLGLARFSEAFLLLRAQNVGLTDALVPTVLVAMNVIYAAIAYPFGKLADRVNRTALLVAGLGALIIADIVLASAPSIWFVFAGAMLWGLHMGATQGLISVLVADAVPKDLRGTGFGVLNLVTGVTALCASVVAGVLWNIVGPSATFGLGAGLTLLSALLFLFFRLGPMNRSLPP